MYKINEVAKQFSIKTNVLRFYEKKGLIQPGRNENEYRLYSIEDIAKVQTILLLRNMGFSIANISTLLKENQEPMDLFIHQYEVLTQHIHSMNIIRSSLEECIDELFQNNSYSDFIVKKMEETTKVLSYLNNWEDKWDFNSWAVRYDEEIRVKHKGLDFYKNYDEVLHRTSALISKNNGLVVDIGVGTGNLSSIIINKNNVVGIDQSINMLKEAKRKVPDLKVRIGTFLQLPVSDNSVDNIVTSYAFHHCNDNEKILAIKEMDRILKSGGRIIIADLMFYNQRKKDEFISSCSPTELLDIYDEYFALVVEIEKIFISLEYTCSIEQVDDLIWIICAQKGM